MIRLQLGDQYIELKPPKISGGAIFIVLLLFAAVAAALSSIYTVKTEEEGVVLRFGKYLKTVQPGLNFKIPFGVDKVAIVPVRRQMKQEFGFGTRGNEYMFQHNLAEAMQEKDMVTGDQNAALVEWVVQFRISDPKAYLFNVSDPDDTLRDASESVMREVVGDRTVDEVITIGRQDIESECLSRLQELVKFYEMGLTIDQVQLKDVDPPEPVQASFNEVNQAQQEKEKSINIANGEYNRSVPRARGEAQQVISEAEGYATERVNEAEGDAAKFTALFNEYQKAPDVTKRRIYLETMETVMPKLGKKVIMDNNTQQALPLLPLGNLNPTTPDR
ncbi:MAG: FtsH protease activity modulator HflK [Verrucomicrobiota bacterium]